MTNKTEAGEAISDEQIREIAARFSADPRRQPGHTMFYMRNLESFARALLALTPPAAPSVTMSDMGETLYRALKSFLPDWHEDEWEDLRPSIQRDYRGVAALLAQRAGTGGDAMRHAVMYRLMRAAALSPDAMTTLWAATEGFLPPTTEAEFDAYADRCVAIDAAMEAKS